MRKHRKLLISIGLLVAVAIIVPLVILNLGNSEAAPTPTATISSPQGEVMVQKEGSAVWIIAVAGMKLYAGDRVKTGNGTTEVVFFEGSVMEVNADSETLVSEMSIAPNTGSTSIRLKQVVGHTVNRVQKLVDSSSRYEVETPAGSAVVRGTTFKFYVRADGYTVIACEEGNVSFTAGGVTVQVNEGQQSSAMPGGTPSTPSAFHIENMIICSDVSGDRDYTSRPDAAFDPGERVWIYFEAFSFAWNTSNGTYEIWYRITDSNVNDPDGELYMSSTSPVEFHQTGLNEITDYLWGAFYIELVPGVSAGQYEAVLAFQDVLSGQTDSITVYFNVKGNPVG